MKSLAIIFILCVGLAWAQPPTPRTAPVTFTDTTLDNGLRVLISQDHFAPLFALAISYKVGSRDEREGHAGLAHLVETLMFKGSENVGDGELYYYILTRGGNATSSITTDRTVFSEAAPKNELDTLLYLEADRMRALNITKQNLDSQRQAIKVERLREVDYQPYGRTRERVDDLIYDNFAYKHSVIGSTADLDAVTLDDLKQFYQTYYAPNNAVLALAGDLDIKETLAKVKKYFGGIARQPAPKPVDLTEPEKAGGRRGRLEDRLAPATRVEIDYQTPGANSSDTRALSVAASILGFGDSARLYQRLVREKRLARQIGCLEDARAGPSTFRVVAYLSPGKTAQEAEAVITNELNRLSSDPVSERELERVRNVIRRSLPPQRESMLHVAMTLAEDTALYNDPARINTEPEKHLAITAADIQKAAKAWLKNSNRMVMVTEP